GDRVQEASPQEFAPQARLSRRDHGASHHRDPDRQRQTFDRPAAEEGKGRGTCRRGRRGAEGRQEEGAREKGCGETGREEGPGQEGRREGQERREVMRSNEKLKR